MYVEKLKNIVILCGPALVWGVLFIIASKVLKNMDPIYLAIFRYLPASLVILLVLYYKEGKEAFKIDKSFVLVALLGMLTMFGFNVLVWIGVSISSGVIAAIFQPLMPLIAVILSFLFFSQPSSIYTVATVVLALIGALLATSNGDISFFKNGNSLGALFIFLGVCLSVFGGILSQKFKNFSMLRFTAITNSSGVLFICILTFILNSSGLISTPKVDDLLTIKWEIIYIIIFTGPLPLFLWYKGFELIGTVNGMLLNNLIPLVTICGSLILGYAVSTYHVIGAIIIIIAMFLHYFNIRSQNN